MHARLSRIFAVVAMLAAGAPDLRADDERAHFHHVHLNVVDPAASSEFYSRIFGAVPVSYANVVPALFTERSFLLFNKVPTPPPSALESGIWHIGWGGVDMPNEYEWFKKQRVSIHTPLYELGDIHVTYLNGPDKELIEVNTMGHHRFAHVHLFAEDVNHTVQWYVDQLGVTPRRPNVPKPDYTKARAWANSFVVDNVQIIVYGRPDFTPPPPWWRWEPLLEFQPTKGRAIDHIAFSYRNIGPVQERMQSNGVAIAEPIAHRPEVNHTSFFVEGPDKVLIEIVQAKPIPEGMWDE